MKTRTTLAAFTIFAAGAIAGGTLVEFVPEARAGEVEWSEAVRDPEFRAAVIEVINACIVENSIIYCN